MNRKDQYMKSEDRCSFEAPQFIPVMQGDVLVCRMKTIMSESGIAHLRKGLKDYIPGVRLLIMEKEADFEITQVIRRVE